MNREETLLYLKMRMLQAEIEMNGMLAEISIVGLAGMLPRTLLGGGACMRIVVDKMPRKPSECLFLQWPGKCTMGGADCILSRGKIVCPKLIASRSTPGTQKEEK